MPSRRSFLQMLGLGGAATLVTTAAEASPVVPLFSGKESKIWTPEHTSLTRSHLVFVRSKDPKVPKGFGPIVGGKKLNITDYDKFDPVEVYLEEGEDPHEAYYKASMEMRRRFAQDSQKRLLSMPEYERQGMLLVTLVDNPIFAQPPGYSWENPEHAFELVIGYTPYEVWSTDDIELNGWEIYSENGEFPIEIPTDLDMDRLLHVDSQIITGKQSMSQLHGRLILP